jgi:tetratricopeptide (TPR) repeat protein
MNVCAGAGLTAVAIAVACASNVPSDRPEPHPVPAPDLTRMSEDVRAQLRERYAALTTTLAAPSTPAIELANAYGDLGAVLLAARYLETAEPALLNARALAPDDPRWPYYLAHLYRSRGALEQASTFLREVLARRPGDLPALVWLASVSIDQGRYDDAEPLLDSALRLDSQSDAAHYQAGRLALARRDFATAVRHFETVLRHDARAGAVHYPLALAYRGLGRQADADAELRLRDRRNADVAPADPLMDRVAALLAGRQAFLVRGTEALNRGEWAIAVEEFRKGLERAPADPVLRHRLGTALFMMGNAREARREFEDVVRQSPGYAPAQYSLGLLLEAAGNARDAIDHFVTAVKSQPTYVAARLRLAAALRRSGRVEEALDHYEQVTRLDPRVSEAALESAITLVRLRRYSEARDRLLSGMEAYPGQRGFAAALARLLAAAPDDRVRDGGRALALAEKMLSADQSTEVGETMAMALAEIGEYGEAVRIQRELIAAARQAGRPDLAATLQPNLRLYEQRKPCRTPWRDEDVGDTPLSVESMIRGTMIE